MVSASVTTAYGAVRAGPREIKSFKSIATNPKAYGFTMTVRLPDDFFIHQEKVSRPQIGHRETDRNRENDFIDRCRGCRGRGNRLPVEHAAVWWPVERVGGGLRQP